MAERKSARLEVASARLVSRSNFNPGQKLKRMSTGPLSRELRVRISPGPLLNFSNWVWCSLLCIRVLGTRGGG